MQTVYVASPAKKQNNQRKYNVSVYKQYSRTIDINVYYMEHNASPQLQCHKVLCSSF